MTRRRTLVAAGAGWPLLPASVLSQRAGAGPAPAGGTLRVAFDFAETGFDPPRVSDQSSLQVIAHIFESPLAYDPLAQPVRLVPLTAAALPEVNDGARRFVFTLRPGIFFADDAAFGGRPRELVAADYVFSIKRYYDPALRSEHLYQFEIAQILGLSELRRRALAERTPFDYDSPVAGLRALDRYRFELRLAAPAPRLPYLFTQSGLTGAVAREVVQAHADDPMAHPVGTGPFRLVQWRRASRIVLERNPRFRERLFEASPPPQDAELVALAQQLRGRRLPLLQRVEISVIEESQPRWLAFLGGELDLLTLPSDFAPKAMPGGRLAPCLARRGVRARVSRSPSVAHTFFNFDDATVGGYGAAQVALRRAIALAYDNEEENRHVYGGQHQLAQGMIPPLCYGHEDGLHTEMGRGDLARARAAGPLRLDRPRRRRLARAARRPPARAAPRVFARPARAPHRRAVAQAHGGDRPAPAGRVRALWRTHQALAGRPVDDVGLQLERTGARRRLLPRTGLRSQQ